MARRPLIEALKIDLVLDHFAFIGGDHDVADAGGFLRAAENEAHRRVVNAGLLREAEISISGKIERDLHHVFIRHGACHLGSLGGTIGTRSYNGGGFCSCADFPNSIVRMIF